MRTKDFQEATANRITEIFRSGQQKRVLLADEVGLGKTIIASAVIQKVAEMHRPWDDHFKVVYICSNINIANQNCRKLGIPEGDRVNFSDSRLSMQHLRIFQTENKPHSYQQLIPMTPATSFSMTGGQGTQSERALILAMLKHCSAFGDYCRRGKRLYKLLQFDPSLQYWDGWAAEYEQRALDCDRESGGKYFAHMTQAIAAYFREVPALHQKLKGICDRPRIDSIPYVDQRAAVNDLRKMFAHISLNRLEPDLVIMDEFQRFRDLLEHQKSGTDENENRMVADRFLFDDRTKVLLLSATPYKPYSTLAELAETGEDHYAEFMVVMDFLLSEAKKRNQFHEVWRGYAGHLAEITTDNLTVLQARKNDAQDAMYQCVCRTERRSDAIIDSSKARTMDSDVLSAGDVQSYVEMQDLMDHLGLGRFPMDYVKSAPYLLSFMNYKVKDQIVDRLAQAQDYRQVERSRTLLLRRKQINDYEQLPCNNGRLQTLWNEVFGQEHNGAELLLWIPASKPYYRTDGVFDRNAGYSKLLVFSKWEMVPRMIAAMTSYEAERLTLGRLTRREDIPAKHYFAEENRERRRFSALLRDEIAEVLRYPSRQLAQFYTPCASMGVSLCELRAAVGEKVAQLLSDTAAQYDLPQGKQHSAAQILALLKIWDGETPDEPLRMIPAGAQKLLTDLAIGGPGVCVLRLLGEGDEATKLTEKLVNLFNKPESKAVLDALFDQDGGEEFYYEQVARYCVEGNLQAVLDEYAYTLGGDAAAMLEGFGETATVQVETRESFLKKYGNSNKSRMRTHFAVGYYTTKIDGKTTQRAENIRAAFNAPFRPFVLATTSIGQEGLDFHNYCRKLMHWNLPANPIDLEQREGRVNRYLCHAIRQNIALDPAANAQPFTGPVWPQLLERMASAWKGDHSDLIPYWCLPDNYPFRYRIERIVPMYPFSRDQLHYRRLIDVLSAYRLTLGQPRQEELLETIHRENIDPGELEKLYMDLSPWEKDNSRNLQCR